jgi:sugar-specific transcriptional regulator TrmB
MRRLIISDEEIQTLQFLGLTFNQAGVYVALVNLGTSNAKTLANASGLATCDVYRIMQELLKLGLVEALVTTPKEFRATPPEAAMEILINRKVKMLEEIKIKAADLSAKMKRETRSSPMEDSKMTLVPHNERAMQFGLPLMLNTKKQLYAVQTDQLFRKFMRNTADSLKILLKKEVELRFIVESEKALEKSSVELSAILKHQNFNVRFINEIPACVLIHDDTNVFIGTSTDALQAPSYWSTNPCMIKIVRSYFEMMWHKARKRTIEDAPIVTGKNS